MENEWSGIVSTCRENRKEIARQERISRARTAPQKMESSQPNPTPRLGAIREHVVSFHSKLLY